MNGLMICYSATLRRKSLEALMQKKSRIHFKPQKIGELTCLDHREDLDMISGFLRC